MIINQLMMRGNRSTGDRQPRTNNGKRPTEHRQRETEKEQSVFVISCKPIRLARIMTALSSWLVLILQFLIFPTLGQSRTIPIGKQLIETTEIQDIEYVAISRVVNALHGKIWQLDNKWIVLVNADTNNHQKLTTEIIFTLSADTIIVNKRAVRSPFPLKKVEKELFVPVFVLGEIFPLPKPAVPNIKSIVLTEIKDTTVLTIDVDTTVRYETMVLSSLEYHLYLQATFEPKELRPKGIVKNIVLGSKTGTSLALYFNKPCDQKIKKTANGIVLKCYPRPQKKITTIVLDPGHGGIDPGAIGRNGLKEKTVNLGIALRLKSKLEALGLRCLLTREEDKYVSLADRVKFAKLSKADLFVSIHCNAAVRDKSKRGFETYFLSDAKTDWERAVAARENAAIQFEVTDTNPITNNDLSLILSDLAQNEFLLESQELAAHIQEAASVTCKTQNRGVMQANFYVLRGNFMPAVLVECGYISNINEEKLLMKKDYWEKIATGIFTGIKRFIANFEKKYAER